MEIFLNEAELRRFIFKVIGLLAIGVLCTGCGGGGGGTSGSTPAANVQLAGIESDFIDGANRNSTTVLYLNPAGDTFEQWTADASSTYYYDADGTLIQEDIEYSGTTSMDRVLYFYDADGRMTSKRYARVAEDGHDQLYLTVNFAYDVQGNIASENHIIPYATDADGNLLVEDTLLATIAYVYAYKDASQTDLILIEKRSISDDGEARVYFSYDAENENVTRVEYDWDNDFNIDAIVYVTYDGAGNRESDEIYDYDLLGNEFLKLTIFYTWESVAASPAASPLTDSGLALGLSGGPYY